MNALIGVERLFAWLLQTTWQAAVIALLILVAQFLLRERLSPGWRYGLWFLLVARLLMPMTPSSTVSVFNLAKWHKPQTAATEPDLLPVAPNAAPAQKREEPLKFERTEPAVAFPRAGRRIANRAVTAVRVIRIATRRPSGEVRK